MKKYAEQGESSGLKVKNLSPLFQRTLLVIKAIPRGKVLSYSRVAKLISAPGCARHVSYILGSSSKKYLLPWHRVVNAKGQISFPIGSDYLRQRKLLEKEGVEFSGEQIDLSAFLWKPAQIEIKELLRGVPQHKPNQ